MTSTQYPTMDTAPKGREILAWWPDYDGPGRGAWRISRWDNDRCSKKPCPLWRHREDWTRGQRASQPAYWTDLPPEPGSPKSCGERTRANGGEKEGT